MDQGHATGQEEAEALLRSFRMQFVVGPEIAESIPLQAGLLTAVNAARRSIHGAVTILGDINVPLLLPFPRSPTLEAAAIALGARLTDGPERIPSLVFGTATLPHDDRVLQVTFDNWVGGILPIHEQRRLSERGQLALPGAVAGALGTSELFQALQGRDARPGRRRIGLDVWDPTHDWLLGDANAPQLEFLPSKVWVLGLGHLGQAFLWHLAMLPYDNESDVRLTLHDVDELVPANISTSPLTSADQLGLMKTRAMAALLESRGFVTRIVERPFTATYRVELDDPLLCFCGVDNPDARAALEDCKFNAIVEAGLGAGQDYLAYQLHTFPGPAEARTRWGGPRLATETQVSPGIRALAEAEDLDECGLTELAGVKVGASFVGLSASALALGQMLRPLHGEVMHGALSGTLASVNRPLALPGKVGANPVRYAAEPIHRR